MRRNSKMNEERGQNNEKLRELEEEEEEEPAAISSYRNAPKT
jgi:hypothetical protein